MASGYAASVRSDNRKAPRREDRASIRLDHATGAAPCQANVQTATDPRLLINKKSAAATMQRTVQTGSLTVARRIKTPEQG